MAQHMQHMQRMQSLHAQFSAAGSTEEKQRIMNEMCEEMRSAMAAMHGDAHGGMPMPGGCPPTSQHGGMGMHGGGHTMPGMGMGGRTPQ
jgi:hypothetical protein